MFHNNIPPFLSSVTTSGGVECQSTPVVFHYRVYILIFINIYDCFLRNSPLSPSVDLVKHSCLRLIRKESCILRKLDYNNFNSLPSPLPTSRKIRLICRTRFQDTNRFRDPFLFKFSPVVPTSNLLFPTYSTVSPSVPVWYSFNNPEPLLSYVTST